MNLSNADNDALGEPVEVLGVLDDRLSRTNVIITPYVFSAPLATRMSLGTGFMKFRCRHQHRGAQTAGASPKASARLRPDHWLSCCFSVSLVPVEPFS